MEEDERIDGCTICTREEKKKKSIQVGLSLNKTDFEVGLRRMHNLQRKI